MNAQYQDQTINCRDCKIDFMFEAGEQAFFAEKQFTAPTRCKACRQIRKAQKEQGGAPMPTTGAVVQGGPPAASGQDEMPRPRNGGRRREEPGRRNSRGYDRED